MKVVTLACPDCGGRIQVRIEDGAPVEHRHSEPDCVGSRRNSDRYQDCILAALEQAKANAKN